MADAIKPDKPTIKLSTKQPSSPKKYFFGEKIVLSEEEKSTILQDIDSEIQNIKELRTKYGLEDDWREGRDQYDGATDYKDFPYGEYSSNLHIHITSMSVDILKVKAKTQIFVPPVMMLRPLPGAEGRTDLYKDIKLKEQYLDYRICDENEVGAESKLDPVFEDAINLGTGIAKVSYKRQKEPFTDIEYYRGLADIDRYRDNFIHDKDKDTYKEHIKRLENDETIEVFVDKEDYIFDNPIIDYVQLENLYVRPDIPDLRNHRVIAERIPSQSWIQINSLIREGFFEKDVFEQIKENNEEYYKDEYTIWENNYYYDYDKIGTAKRCIITYIEPKKTNKKIFARAITYPYTHRQPNYVFYYIKKRKGLIYGEGLAKRLKHANTALNNLWNQTVDSGAIRNLPMFAAIKNTEFDSTIKKLGPGIIWWIKNRGDVEVLHAGGISGETLALISRLERYAEWQTGVSAYMTGRESPLDPQAPMGKAYMLLRESNLRVSDSIKSLQKSNIQLWSMLDKIIYQFSGGNELKYFQQSAEKFDSVPVSPDLLAMKVQYVPQGTDITINKELQKQQDMAFASYLQSRPIIQMMPKAERTILEILIRNQGGIWEKNIANLLPPVEPPTPTPTAPPPVTGETPATGVPPQIAQMLEVIRARGGSPV